MLRLTAGGVALLALALAIAVWLTGDVRVAIAGTKFSARDEVRPLVVAVAGALLYSLLSGWPQVRRDAARIRAALTPSHVSGLVALGSVVLALGWNSWTASTSDAYAYVTQADLWLQGRLRIPMPIAEAAPWPAALSTFTPLGYRAAPDETAIVPVTGPGLPLLMALLKSLGGHCAAFLVAPLMAGVLAWATFIVGRRARDEAIGLGAAWLVATSPTVLAMGKSVMSDVPAAACWTLATAGLLAASTAGAVLGGLAASAAILIRPNLVPIAAVMAAWALWRDRHEPRQGRHRALAFAAAVVPGCLFVAGFNAALYGSPLSSGYGSPEHLFAWGFIGTNLSHFGHWLLDTQTPLAFGGIVALALPFSALWPEAPHRRAAALLFAVVVTVLAAYAAYTPYDAWWFLRFLLPAWPAMGIGVSAMALAAGARGGRWGRRAGAVVLVALGVHGVAKAVQLGVYPPGEGERWYVTVAEFVQQATEPSAVIVTGPLHSGSLRYYAGRLTLRFDQLDPAWLDDAADWLIRQGRHPYILLEDWERPEFERRFAGTGRLGRLPLAPVLAYKPRPAAGMALLFDPLRPDGPTTRPPPVADPRPRCAPPVPSPSFGPSSR